MVKVYIRTLEVFPFWVCGCWVHLIADGMYLSVQKDRLRDLYGDPLKDDFLLNIDAIRVMCEIMKANLYLHSNHFILGRCRQSFHYNETALRMILMLKSIISVTHND